MCWRPFTKFAPSPHEPSGKTTGNGSPQWRWFGWDLSSIDGLAARTVGVTAHLPHKEPVAQLVVHLPRAKPTTL